MVAMDLKPDSALPRDEEGLLARAAAGDARAFEALMRQHNRLLFRTARSILRHDAESEDAVQEAYVKAWRGLPGFRRDAKLSTWLVRIVMNEQAEAAPRGRPCPPADRPRRCRAHGRRSGRGNA